MADLQLDFGVDQIYVRPKFTYMILLLLYWKLLLLFLKQLQFDGIGGGGEASTTANKVINEIALDLIPLGQEYAKNYALNLLKFVVRGYTMEQLVDLINMVIGEYSIK